MYEIYNIWSMRLLRTTNPADPMRTVPILNEGHSVTQRGIGGPAFPKNKVAETAQMNTMESGRLEETGPIQGNVLCRVMLVTGNRHARTNKYQ